jgi:C-terminal processing protease CtpA/Prc
LNDGLLYAKIDMFSASTVSEFEEILNENNDYSSLIIDLRENKGGYIYSAADISSIFYRGRAFDNEVKKQVWRL